MRKLWRVEISRERKPLFERETLADPRTPSLTTPRLRLLSYRWIELYTHCCPIKLCSIWKHLWLVPLQTRKISSSLPCMAASLLTSWANVAPLTEYTDQRNYHKINVCDSWIADRASDLPPTTVTPSIYTFTGQKWITDSVVIAVYARIPVFSLRDSLQSCSEITRLNAFRPSVDCFSHPEQTSS